MAVGVAVGVAAMEAVELVEEVINDFDEDDCGLGPAKTRPSPAEVIAANPWRSSAKTNILTNIAIEGQHAEY